MVGYGMELVESYKNEPAWKAMHSDVKLAWPSYCKCWHVFVLFLLFLSSAMVPQHFVLCISKMLPQIERNGLLPSLEPQASSYKTGAILLPRATSCH